MTCRQGREGKALTRAQPGQPHAARLCSQPDGRLWAIEGHAQAVLLGKLARGGAGAVGEGGY